MKNRKAVSPVIATVILVAVAITVAVAVAYWMGGIAGQYTKFEKVEIQSGVCTFDSGNGNWTITLKMKNTGTAAATMISCFINEVEVVAYDVSSTADDETATNMTTTTMIESGASHMVKIYIGGSYASLSSGTAVNIKIHSAGGMYYIELIELI